MAEIKYCAFIDVLGYGSLVTDPAIDFNKKESLLHSIYSNLATQFSLVILEINKAYKSKIYIRSFSDCFYLDCSEIEPLIVAIENVYSYAFGFYAEFSEDEERTPLLRCGIVKDWIIKFRDIGGIINGTTELNPVGLAVARAYYTSEKSYVSGMRVIISSEVIQDMNLVRFPLSEYDCYVKAFSTYGFLLNYYFKPITINEKNDPTKLYEMLWPYRRVNDQAYECIDILKKLKYTFSDKSRRHFIKTVELFSNSHRLSEWKTKDQRIFMEDKTAFQELSKY